MTEPGKNAPGLVGFPTPNAASMVDAYLLFLFADPTWAQWILGALEPLVYEWNWYKSGDMETWEASEAFRLIIQQAPYNLLGSNDVEAPFWDDSSGDDAPVVAPPDEQPWFGVWDGETFVESLSYWAVSAFLAQAVGEGAAIQFITPLRTFRLTLRKNPHGAKLLVLMDANIFQLVDLFSATDEVTTVDIVSPGSTLMLVHSGEHNPDATPDENGNYTVDVIKSQLSESDVVPPNIRWTDTDPPVFQTTNDDGVTWADAPTADPRYNPANLMPPLTPYTGIECDVAARMTAQLHDTLDIFLASVDAAQFASGVLALLAFEGGWIGWLVDLIILVANVLIDIGQADIEAAFTTAVYDDIQCIFSCYVGEDGQITQSALDSAYDDIQAAHPGVVANTIAELRFLYGDVSMCNAGVARDETGDCSGCASCDWFVEFDFTDGGLDGVQIYSDSTLGSYGGYNGQAISFVAFPPREAFPMIFAPGVHITDVALDANFFHGTGIGNALKFFDLTSTGLTPSLSLKVQIALGTVNPRAWIAYTPTAFTTTEGIGLQLVCDSNNTGYIYVYKIRIGGTGTPPTIGRRVSAITP